MVATTPRWSSTSGVTCIAVTLLVLFALNYLDQTMSFLVGFSIMMVSFLMTYAAHHYQIALPKGDVIPESIGVWRVPDGEARKELRDRVVGVGAMILFQLQVGAGRRDLVFVQCPALFGAQLRRTVHPFSGA